MSVRRTKWVWSARGGHVTLATPPFEAILRSYVRTVPGNVHVKFEVRTLTVLELLALNAQKFRWSRDPGHASFSKKMLRVMSGLSLETFEVCDGVTFWKLTYTPK